MIIKLMALPGTVIWHDNLPMAFALRSESLLSSSHFFCYVDWSFYVEEISNSTITITSSNAKE